MYAKTPGMEKPTPVTLATREAAVSIILRCDYRLENIHNFPKARYACKALMQNIDNIQRKSEQMRDFVSV